MNRTERSQAMLAHVAAWKNSGLSRKNYCAEHGLSPHTMAYWCAKAKRRAAPGGFSPVEVMGSGGVEVCYPNGVRLLLPPGTGLAQVSAYIRLY